MSEQSNKAPIQTLRDGAVVVKIWEQNGKNGPYPSATLGRTYRDDRTKEWGEAHSLGRSDLLKAQALLLEANREMAKWQEYYKQQQPAQAQQTDKPLAQSKPSQQGLAAQRDNALANAKPVSPATVPAQDRGPEM